MTLCACGCGGEVNSGRFLQGHGRKGHAQPQSAKDAIGKANTKELATPLLCECGCGELAKPGNRYIFGHYMAGKTDKNSTQYLGIRVAERVLSMVFKNVQVMPYGNRGFDIICNRDKMIDIKASATGDKLGYWKFAIKRNQTADYFLCLAFNDRRDLHNPVHLWLIPADKVNHLITLAISKGTVDKWNKYELPLDKLIACCDTLHNVKERHNTRT